MDYPKTALYIANLTTTKHENLPDPCTPNTDFHSWHITFVPQSSQYKVLYCARFCKALKCRVWTLGKDQSWRNLEISTAGINLDNQVEKTTASAKGILYLSKGRGVISAIDLNLETGYSVEIPDEFVKMSYWLSEMGNYLSCGVNHICGRGEVHVYSLKDLLGNEWVKVYKLVKIVDTRKFMYSTLVPVGWLRNGEIFVFIIRETSNWFSTYVVAYDVKTGKTIYHWDWNYRNLENLFIHTNSLVSWDASGSRGKIQRNELPFFPDDIFFQILVWLPADFLHYYARYVCKSWSVIISDPVFINEHFKRSESGLFFQMYETPSHGNYLGLREGGFEVGAVNGLFPVRLFSSSRGLSLFYEKNVLYVGNLTTRRFESLPSPLSRKERFLGCHIMFVPQSSQYKVLYCVSLCRARKWRVWTLGNDQSWRNLDIPSTVNIESRIENISVSVGGVLYLSKGRGAICAIDLNLENGYSVQIPNEFADKLYWLNEMGDDLSCGVNQKGEVHIYILKDLLTSEWLKVYKLGQVVDNRRFLFRTLEPVGWIKNVEKFVFIIREPGYYRQRFIVAYDVKTGVSVIHKDSNLGDVRTHTNSLVSW